jgi:ribosomal protein L13E
MKKLVMSLLLSLLLITSTNSYSFAQTEGFRHSGPQIEQKAKDLGITVDELKAQRKAEHQAKLEQKAKELGITVDELKAQRKAERQAKLEKKAKELGISVDELKAKIKAKHCD